MVAACWTGRQWVPLRVEASLRGTQSTCPAPSSTRTSSSAASRVTSSGSELSGQPLLPTQKQPRSGQVNSSPYKTELCRTFEEKGACKYGDKCQFAHRHPRAPHPDPPSKDKTEVSAPSIP